MTTLVITYSENRNLLRAELNAAGLLIHGKLVTDHGCVVQSELRTLALARVTDPELQTIQNLENLEVIGQGADPFADCFADAGNAAKYDSVWQRGETLDVDGETFTRPDRFGTPF